MRLSSSLPSSEHSFTSCISAVFLPNTTAASCRTDAKPLLSSPSLASHTVVQSLPEFNSALSDSGTLPLPVLGLFTVREAPSLESNAN